MELKENLFIDPRESVISERLKRIKKVILVSGFKGGIGKSLISVLISIALSEKKYKVGLLDLDLTSSTSHIILGAKNLYPKEDMGLKPPVYKNIKFMSFSFFSNSKAFALRGSSISNAIKELLCVTIWDELDYLIVDMPPGFSDTTFEVERLFNNYSVIAIQTPSPLSKEILKRMIVLYNEKNIKTLIIENMSQRKSKKTIRYDKNIDRAIGNYEKLKRTNMYKDILKIIPEVEKL